MCVETASYILTFCVLVNHLYVNFNVNDFSNTMYFLCYKESGVCIFDKIKIKLQEVGWGMDWIDLALNRDRWRALVNKLMNIWFSQNAGNFLTS